MIKINCYTAKINKVWNVLIVQAIIITCFMPIKVDIPDPKRFTKQNSAIFI